jgi:cytochrome c peroxidase
MLHHEMTKRRRWLTLVCSITLIASCSLVSPEPTSDPSGEPTLSEQQSAVIVGGIAIDVPTPFVGVWRTNRRIELPLGLRGLVLPAGDILDPMLSELGNLLFFDRRLSKTGAISCATCHDPAAGYSAKTLVRGVEGTTLPRTASTALNRGFGTLNTWSGARTLEQQASAPILAHDEMGLTTTSLLSAMSSIPGYADRFERLTAAGVLPAPAISVANLERAIATFERLALMTGTSRVDRYEAGESTALSAAELAGRQLFRTKARCVLCHSGPNFTDEDFHHIVPVPSSDLGRQAVTGLVSDFGKFKTPSLRNAALRGPYFHNGDPLPTTGLATTLETVVRRYNSGPPPNERNASPLIIPLGLSATEQAQLVAFLRALNGSIPNDPRLSAPGTSTSSPRRESIYLSPEIFDAAEYLQLNPDLAGLTTTQLEQHWLDLGIDQGRRASSRFFVDEHVELYAVVYDAIGTGPDRWRRAIDSYLDHGLRLGRVGRHALSRAVFRVQEYRALNPGLALMPQAQAVSHYLSTGLAQRLPAAYAPTEYLLIGGQHYYADGTSYCTLTAAASRAARGRADDIGMVRLPALPVRLQAGGACNTATSPPTPSISPASRDGAIVPFTCRAETNNAGCTTSATCPSGMRIVATRMACNLEFGAITADEFAAVAWSTLKVTRRSDNELEGHCVLDGLDLSSGSLRLFGARGAGPSSVAASCREHDDNGGDCHLLGELLCAPL